jgi:starvation-inducible DNA-binding protein
MELIRHPNLSPEQQDALIQELDQLLAEYQTYQSNVRRIHWNPQLRPYLDFSNKIARLYQVTEANRHLIADTMIRMGAAPSEPVLAGVLPVKRQVTQVMEIPAFEQAIGVILHTSRQMLELVRETFVLAAQYQHQPTMQLMNHLAQQLVFTIGVFSSERLAAFN